MPTISNHIITGSIRGIPVVWTPTNNHNGVISPKYLIFHYTACSKDIALTTFIRDKGENRTSAHIVIDADGSVTQLVPFNMRAWHAGVSVWESLQDLNSHSIGIEVVNYGYLLKTANGEFRLGNGKAAPFKGNEILESHHKNPLVKYSYWHAFTSEQIEACEELAKFLVSEYQLDDILGHDDIAPLRKQDPGPAFPMISIRSKAFGRDSNVNQDRIVFVAVPKLNVRDGPGPEFAITATPVVKYTKLKVLERKSGWLRVEFDPFTASTGWVYADYTENSLPLA